MRDITEKVLSQSREFGRPVRMNVTRVDNYVSQAEHIFRILGADEMTVRIEAGETLVEKRQLKLYPAKKLVRWYGDHFFMNLYYRVDRILVLKLVGVAPSKKKDDEESAAISAADDQWN